MTTGDLTPRLAELLELAGAHYAAGQYREALSTAREALQLSGAAPGLASCLALGVIAECLAELGDAIGALDDVHRGRRLSGDGVPERLLLDTAEGHVLTVARRAHDAIPLLEAAVRPARGDQTRPVAFARAMTMLAAAYATAGRAADALTTAGEALRLGDHTIADRAHPHVTIALATLALDDVARADAAYATAVDVAQRFEERGNEGWAHAAGGAIALRQDDRTIAEQRLDEAQEIAEELGMMPLVERCRALLRRLR